jgi:hypothetical protein
MGLRMQGRGGRRPGTALVVSALGSKREDWMRMRRIGRMLGQQLNGNDWLLNGND